MIKICGITRLVDAEAAVSAGATAVGFVFWPRSPRAVSIETARDIVHALPDDVLKVGVFVDASFDTVQGTARRVGLTAVQLHGSETPAMAAALDVQVLKAVGVPQIPDAAAWPATTMILLDAMDPIAKGGTGVRVDWVAAAAFARTRQTVLAGGLTPDNVSEAVNTVRPFGVDVSSGVEQSPGVKDHEKIRRFVKAAREGLGARG